MYSGTSAKGPSDKQTTSLQRTHTKHSLYTCSVFSLPPQRDNLWIKDKCTAPKVSILKVPLNYLCSGSSLQGRIERAVSSWSLSVCITIRTSLKSCVVSIICTQSAHVGLDSTCTSKEHWSSVFSDNHSIIDQVNSTAINSSSHKCRQFTILEQTCVCGSNLCSLGRKWFTPRYSIVVLWLVLECTECLLRYDL